MPSYSVRVLGPILRAEGEGKVSLPVVLAHLKSAPLAYHALTPMESLQLGQELIYMARVVLSKEGNR